MKEDLQYFLHHLIVQDYILFGVALTLFVLMLVLTLLLRRSLLASMLFLLLSFASLFAIPTLGYSAMHNYLFAHKVEINKIKALEFTNALIIKGQISNESKRNFSTCKISVGVYKVAHNALLDALYPLNPFKKQSIITSGIDKNSTIEYKVVVDNFNYQKDYNASVKAACQ